MKKLLITALFISLPFSSLLYARTQQLSLEALPQKADYAALVKVVDKEARWDERNVMINTHYVMEVEEIFLGNPDSIIFIKCPGGTTADGETILVSDTPQFVVNQTYIIFGVTGEKSYPVVGHEQGVFRVVKDKPSGKQYIIDYFGNLIEKQASGKVVRGRLVDQSVRDRLVLVESTPAKNAPEPKPVVRDATGKVIPQPEIVSVESKTSQSGVPLEKSAFINYITERKGK